MVIGLFLGVVEGGGKGRRRASSNLLIISLTVLPPNGQHLRKIFVHSTTLRRSHPTTLLPFSGILQTFKGIRYLAPSCSARAQPPPPSLPPLSLARLAFAPNFREKVFSHLSTQHYQTRPHSIQNASFRSQKEVLTCFSPTNSFPSFHFVSPPNHHLNPSPTAAVPLFPLNSPSFFNHAR